MKHEDKPYGMPGTLSKLTVAVGMALASMQAISQDAQTTQDSGLEEERLYVTGTRLKPRGMDTATPINVVSEEEFTLTGTQNVEELLLETPQFSGNQLESSKANTVQAGQPIGVSTLNLRNFGATRNLVLVNGRRFAITGPAMTTDINTIPAALVARTEVVTGGSSAVYGSDAIAGVVNFIMKDDFEGLEIDAQSSWDSPSDSPTYNIDLTIGGNFDEGRGNVTASLGYLNRSGFTTNQVGDLAFPGLSDGCVTADSWSSTNAGTSLDTGGASCEEAGGRLGFVTGGSSSVPNGRIGNFPTVGSTGDAELDAALIAAGLQDMTSLGAIFDEAGNTVRPFISPDDRFDFNDNSFILAPQERWMANVFANYDLAENHKAYMEAHYSTNVTSVLIAPPNVGQNFLIDTDNPYLSTEMQNILEILDGRETGETTINSGNVSVSTTPDDGLAIINYGRRFNDLGGRYAEADHNVFRGLVGVTGSLGSASEGAFYDLEYDVYYSYAKTSEVDLQTGSVSRSAVQNLMLSQGGNAPVLNLFGNGNISEEAAAAISVSAVSKIEAEQEVAVASLTGVAFDMPAGPVDFAIGYEWRAASGRYIPDSYLASGDVSGWNSARATSGSQSVTEYFGEFRVPLLSELPGVQQLNFNGAFRVSDYDVGSDGSVNTYSTGLEWAVTDELTFRGQFQHAIRAPNIGELFGGQGSDGPTASDPCSAATAPEDQTAALRDLCIATGVPADSVFDASVQPSPFLVQIRGGNPDLNPEESDTTTFGVVYQSGRFAVSLDYFDIELEDAIAPLGGGGLQNVLDLCYNTLQDADSVYCEAINRDPLSGEISGPRYVYTTNANIGGIKTSGLDLTATWGFETNWGLFGNGSDFSVNTAWTYTDEFTTTPIQDLPEITNECVGAWGGTCGQPLPEYKGSTRFTWETGPALVSLRMRYQGEVTTDRIVVPERRGEEAPSSDSWVRPTIDSYMYFDLTGAYSISDETKVTVGIRNLFDKEAPVLGSLSQGGANTIPATYDVQGRVIYLKLQTRF